jgi:integrase
MTSTDALVFATVPKTDLTREEAGEVLGAWLQNRARATRESYRRDLCDLAAHLGVSGPDEAFRFLLGLSPERAQLTVLRYLGAMRDRGVSAATAKRRLSTLRSLLRAARTVGLIGWQLEVEAPRTAPRGPEGPSRDEIRTALETIETSYEGREQARLRLLVRLLLDLSLRASEPGTALFPEDVDLKGTAKKPHGAIWVLRKRRERKEPWALSRRAREALDAWLLLRGEAPGPLLLSFNHGGQRALSARVTRKLVAELGEIARVRLSPNGLRHAANTIAMAEGQKAGYTLDEIMQYSSHRNPQTLLAYKDRLRDAQGAIAELVSECASGLEE